jgi:uncharacterized repeat protein (TIGR03803 family)
LVRDSEGNLYGTTFQGGSSECGASGCGTVFKLDTAGNETVLHDFGAIATGGANYGDGCWPYQGLVMDSSGALYGTTSSCGAFGYGTIFKIDNKGNFSLLYAFTYSTGSVAQYGHLTLDKSGNLYGVASQAGSDECAEGCGLLYKLSKNGTYTVLHSFNRGPTDGCYPSGSVAMDSAGNLYGTTGYCGNSGNGIIWEVSTTGQETILHNFAGGTTDGCHPVTGVTLDSKGNLYGVAQACGANGNGALYELTAKGQFTLLHSFDGSDGAYPTGEVLLTTNGTLYGTAPQGGTLGNGTVWSYASANPVKTAISLTSSPNPSTVGQDVTFTATITAANGQTPNDGTVTFKYGTTVLATANVSNGVAEFDTTTLPVGKDTITATYSGDSAFEGSTGKHVQVVKN